MYAISRRMLTSFCLVFILAAAPSLRAASKSWQDLRAEGGKASEAGNYYQAEALLTAAAKVAQDEGEKDQAMIYLLLELGQANSDCEHLSLAETAYRRALQLRETVIGPNRIENFELLLPLASTCGLVKKYDEALALFERAQKLVESKIGRFHPWVANCLAGQALVHDAQGHPEKAEPLYRKAVDMAGSQHSNIDYRKEGDPGRSTGGRFYKTVYRPNYLLTAELLENLGRFYLQQKRPADAEKTFERQVKVVEQEFSKDPDSLVNALNHLSVPYVVQKKYPQAEKTLQRVLALESKGIHPLGLAETLAKLAALRVDQQKTSEADAFLERMLRVTPRAGKPGTRDVSNLSRLALHYAREGDPVDGETLLQFAVALKATVWGKDDPRLAPFMGELGRYYFNRHQFDLAEPALKNALALGLKSPAPEARNLLSTLTALIDLSAHNKNDADNRAYATQAIDLIKKDTSNDLYEFVPVVESLVEFSRAAQQPEDVFKLNQHLLAIVENRKVPDEIEVATVCQSLADIHLAKKEHALAEPLLVKALALEEKARGAENMILMTSLTKLATIYTALGKDAELAGILERQITINEDLFGKKNSVLVAPLTEYAGALKRLKRDADAEKIEARIKEIQAPK